MVHFEMWDKPPSTQHGQVDLLFDENIEQSLAL